MTKLYWISIFLFSFFQVEGCRNSKKFVPINKNETKPTMDTNLEKVNFDSTMLSIGKKCETCETWDALFSFKEFINIYEHSNFYIQEAILFLSNDRYTDIQKKICICAMQKASLQNYLAILDKSKIQFDNKRMSESILEWAIVPNFSNRYLVVRNYKVQGVSNFLNSVVQDNKTSPQFKENIEKIISESLWENIKESEGN